jgi:hypothetical protein
MKRAQQIDPGNERLHDRAQEINRECLTPSTVKSAKP